MSMSFPSGSEQSASCPACSCVDTSCATWLRPSDCSNCVSCCCSSSHQSWRRLRISAGVRVEYLSSAWMSVETLGSILFGLAAGSLALLAFGGDSLVELVSGVVVLRHLRRDPGSSRIDNRQTALLTTGLLFALIPVIGAGSVYSYFAGLRPEGSLLGIAIAMGAVIMMPYLWLEKRRIGREARCLPLSIDAVESLTCIFMSTALLAGLLAEFFLGLWWADYVATTVILLFVGREAWESFHEIREE